MGDDLQDAKTPDCLGRANLISHRRCDRACDADDCLSSAAAVDDGSFELALVTKSKQAFRVFDRDGDGYIDKKDLRHLMRNLGETLTNKEVDEMFKVADNDGDGKLSFDDFLNMMRM